LYKVYALAESLQKQKRDFILNVLVSDSDSDYKFANCRFWKLLNLTGEAIAESIIHQYQGSSDKLRWSLKPVFMKFLLETGNEKLVYLDNDQYFYSDYRFLFDSLDEHSFLLTPHYYKHNPNKEQNWLEATFKVGLYNAGFIGANKNALNTLQWWAECCNYRCEKNSWRGLFDDQKYLDLIPVIDEGAHIIRHTGCNLASWNNEWCERKIINGQLKINEKFAVVFIHFNGFTVREILEGRDILLLPFLNEYIEVLKKYKSNFKIEELQSAKSMKDKLKYYVWEKVTKLGI